MTTMDTNGPNTAQIEHWNSRVGEAWAAFQQEMDASLSPLGELALTAANALISTVRLAQKTPSSSIASSSEHAESHLQPYQLCS